MHPKVLLEACTELVGLVLKFEHPADATVAHFFRAHRSLGSRERATLTQTVFNILRKKLFFDHCAPSGSGAKERRLAILGFDGTRDFLMAALSDQEKKWLAQCDQLKEADLLERHRHNLPEWLAQLLKEELKEQFWPWVSSLDRSPSLDIRVNTFTAKRPDIVQELAAAHIVANPTPYSPWGLRLAGKPALTKLDAYTRGAIEVQDEGSQLLAFILDAKRGEMVADFCAGAGGKTLALGAMMRSTGRLYAFDTSAHRLDALKPRMARSKLSNVHPAVIAHERDERIKRLAGKMDRVLVDAPCSGLGTLRRSPDLRWRLSLAQVQEVAIKQAAILQSAARLVKLGGRLVYATCSILQAENEAIAAAFSAANPDFELLDMATLLDDLKVANSAVLCAGPKTGTEYLRLWPHQHETDGFFAATWVKKR